MAYRYSSNSRPTFQDNQAELSLQGTVTIPDVVSYIFVSKIFLKSRAYVLGSSTVEATFRTRLQLKVVMIN